MKHSQRLHRRIRKVPEQSSQILTSKKKHLNDMSEGIMGQVTQIVLITLY